MSMVKEKMPDFIAKEKLQEIQFDTDLKEALNSRSMRRILWWVMTDSEMSDIYSIPMTTNAEVYFSNGRRYIGMVLFRAIEAIAPDALLKMQKEEWVLSKLGDDPADMVIKEKKRD